MTTNTNIDILSSRRPILFDGYSMSTSNDFVSIYTVRDYEVITSQNSTTVPHDLVIYRIDV